VLGLTSALIMLTLSDLELLLETMCKTSPKSILSQHGIIRKHEDFLNYHSFGSQDCKKKAVTQYKANNEC
jgi:hypothetical protein